MRALAGSLREQIGRVLVGQESAVELLLIALFVRGHVLVEGVPGTAKTLMAKTLARLVSAEFRRIQFTPDLMPSDVIGTVVFDLNTSQFRLKRGPIFTQILLADEINRAPAKTQSALLEAMEERQVSIEGETHLLPDPFLVVATQNPVEMDGTYPLPEAQLDRFLFKLTIPYLELPHEIEVLRRAAAGFDAHDLDAVGLQPVLDAVLLARIRQVIQTIRVEESLLKYIASIITATRRSGDLLLGASTRASVALLHAARAYAVLNGRDYVMPDDIKTLVSPVLRHRVLLRPETEIDGLDADSVLRRILAQVEVPR